MNDISQSIVIPERPETLVNSSSVLGYSYDSNQYVLTVWFKGKKPSIYTYFMVFPPQMSAIFDTGGSIGKKIQQLKNNRKVKLR